MKYTRRFLVAASAYRRACKSHAGLRFGADELQAQWAHETHGAPKPDARVNGFTCGKWILDVTLAAMREDHAAGLFTKAELMRGSSAFVRREIKRWPVVSFARP